MFHQATDQGPKAKNKGNKGSSPAEEEMEEEMERPRVQFLNRQKDAFGTGEGGPFGGINTAPSVFEQKSTFHTEE